MDVVLGVFSVLGRVLQGVAAFVVILVSQIITGIAFVLALVISAGPLIVSVLLLVTILLVPAIEFNQLSAGISPFFDEAEVTQNNIIDTLNTIIGIGESAKRVYNKGAFFIMGLLHAGTTILPGGELFEYADQLRRMNHGLDAVEIARHRNIIVENLTRDKLHKLKYMSTEDRNRYLNHVERSADAYVDMMTHGGKVPSGRINVDLSILNFFLTVAQALCDFLVAIITIVSVPTFLILDAFLSVVVIDPFDGSISINTSFVVEFVKLIIEEIIANIPFAGCFLPVEDLPSRVIGCTCSWRYEQNVYTPLFEIGTLTKIAVPSNILVAMIGCVCFKDDVDLENESNPVDALRKCFDIDDLIATFADKAAEVAGPITDAFNSLLSQITDLASDVAELASDVADALNRVTSFCNTFGCRSIEGGYEMTDDMKRQIMEEHGTLAYHAMDLMSFMDPDEVARAARSAENIATNMRTMAEVLETEFEDKLNNFLGFSDIFSNTTAAREYIECVRNHTAANSGECDHPLNNMISPQARQMGVGKLYHRSRTAQPIVDHENMGKFQRNLAATQMLTKQAERNIDHFTSGFRDQFDPDVDGSYFDKKLRSLENISDWTIMQNATREVNEIYGEKGGVAFRALLTMASGVARWSRWVLTVDMNSNDVSLFAASERLVEMAEMREGYMRSIEFLDDLHTRNQTSLMPAAARRLRRGFAVFRALILDEDHLDQTLQEVAQMPHDEDAARELGQDLNYVRNFARSVGESPLMNRMVYSRQGTASAMAMDRHVSEHIERSAKNLGKLASNAEEEAARIEAATQAMLKGYRMEHHRAAARHQRAERGHPHVDPFSKVDARGAPIDDAFEMDDSGRVVNDPEHMEPRTYDFKITLTSTAYIVSVGVGGAALTVVAGIVGPLLTLLAAAILFVLQLAAVLAQGIIEKFLDTDSVVFNFFDRIFDAIRLVGFQAYSFGITPAILTTFLNAVEKQIEDNIEYGAAYAVYKFTCAFPVGIGEQKCGPVPQKDVNFFDYLYYGLVRCDYKAPCLSTDANPQRQRCFCPVNPGDPLSAQREGTTDNPCIDGAVVTGITHCFPFFVENTYLNRVDYEWNVQPDCTDFENEGLPFWRRGDEGFFTIATEFVRDVTIDAYKVVTYAWRRFLGSQPFGEEGLFAGVGAFLFVIPGFLLTAISTVTAGQFTIQESVNDNLGTIADFFNAFEDVPLIGGLIGPVGTSIAEDFLTPTAGTPNDDACAIRYSPTVVWAGSVLGVLAFVGLGTIVPTALILLTLLLVELFAIIGIIFGRSIALYLASVRLSRARMIEPRYDIAWVERTRRRVVNQYNRARSSRFMPLALRHNASPDAVLPSGARMQPYGPMLGLVPEADKAPRKQLIATAVKSDNYSSPHDIMHAAARVHGTHMRENHESWAYAGMGPFVVVRYVPKGEDTMGARLARSNGGMTWRQAAFDGLMHWINAIPYMLSWQFVREAVATRPLRGLYTMNPSSVRLMSQMGFHRVPEALVKKLYEQNAPHEMGVARYDSKTPLSVGADAFNYMRYIEGPDGVPLVDSRSVDVFDKGYYTQGGINGHRDGLTLYTADDTAVVMGKKDQ